MITVQAKILIQEINGVGTHIRDENRLMIINSHFQENSVSIMMPDGKEYTVDITDLLQAIRCCSK
jgi:hypothetical protein